ncbi:dehydrase and lipid transport-domain-containing protein [Amylostereum chailletii]|nr:dehydrase and lipid transport-domain-containing protein [Amylostereum chailletii]
MSVLKIASHRCARRGCRTLFSLPDLSSLSPFSNSNSDEPPDGLQTYHERKILPYTRRELYRIVSDVSSYSKFIPFCTQSRIIGTPRPLQTLKPHDPAHPPTQMDGELTVSFLTFKESYVSTVTCRPFESVEAVASSSTPLFKSLTTTWKFLPASSRSPHPSMSAPLQPTGSPKNDDDAGPTLLTLDLSYAFANPLHAAISGAFFGQVSKAMVKAFEDRCLVVYGPGTR